MTYVSENFWHDAVNKATTDLFTFGYKHIIKPHFVFNQTPDVAHDQMIQFCKITKNIPPLMWACREMLNYSDPVLETSVMGVDFANPFGLSAGLDKNCEMPVLLDNVGFGFETVGSTTSRPCPGNPKPWFHRLPEYDSMMVHVGLANEGSEIVVPRAEQAWTKARDMQISVSIARTNDDKTGDLDEGIEDYCISMRRAAGRTAMVEVNISCPNTMAGEPFNQSPEALDKLFTELDKIERPQPTLVKMPLNKSWEEFKDLLDVLAEHNVQACRLRICRRTAPAWRFLAIGRADCQVRHAMRPATNASSRCTASMATVLRLPASAACSLRSRRMRRFVPARRWSCSSAR